MRIGAVSAAGCKLNTLIGDSVELRRACELIERYASARSPVLLSGETGTGKELAARALHYAGCRAGKAFVPVNCGALPDTLLESDLFGHARGSFTDASRARLGLVRKAENGTLFLDEVEALTTHGQVALLRFLENSSFRVLGEEDLRLADVRIVAASNVDLERLVGTGQFRADLFYRLAVLRIEMPALRRRSEDMEALVMHLLHKAADIEGGRCKHVTPQGLALLQRHSWPGNVRELEHTLLRAHLSSCSAELGVDDLSSCLPERAQDDSVSALIDRLDLDRARKVAVQLVERDFVEHVLRQHDGNISAAARACKMERATMSRLAKRVLRAEPGSRTSN